MLLQLLSIAIPFPMIMLVTLISTKIEKINYSKFDPYR